MHVHPIGTSIQVSSEALHTFCQHYHIRYMALFGSVLRDDFSLASDIDVLVEFAPDHVPGFAFIRIQDELQTLFGGQHPIDLVTIHSLHPHIRDHVLRHAQVIYAQP